MRVLVAGASGVVGRALIPMLVGRGHDVAGLVRTSASGLVVAELGAKPLIGDALDRVTVSHVFREFRPEVVIHQLTSLRGATDLWIFDTVFAQTNLLRTRELTILLRRPGKLASAAS